MSLQPGLVVTSPLKIRTFSMLNPKSWWPSLTQQNCTQMCLKVPLHFSRRCWAVTHGDYHFKKVDYKFFFLNKNNIKCYLICFLGPARLQKIASHMPGCRTPTWWSSGDRLSPSPPADLKSSWWNNKAVAQRKPPSTKCCCGPTRAPLSPRHLGLLRMFLAQSEVTVKKPHWNKKSELVAS